LLTDQYDKQIAKGDIISLANADVTTYGLTSYSLGSDSTYAADLSASVSLDGNYQLGNLLGKQWLKL
jgi:hypothetical protein